MYLLSSSVLTAVFFSVIRAADPKIPKPTTPCTITSPSRGTFHDLNPIAVRLPDSEKKAHKDDKTSSWHARGYDYGANFTLNFCAPVVEKLEDVVGIDEKLWRNVSAYYTKGGDTYSIGQLSTEPVFRGSKLVLNYTMGSPCKSSNKRKREIIGGHGDDDDDDEDDDDDDDDKKYHKAPKSGSEKARRKSTLISLLCDRDTEPGKATVAFVGASPDECTYFFEAISEAACGKVGEAQQSVGPAGVFGIIALIAAAVYLFGGIAYQRTVMHQRGWRQLPNYSIWAGIGSFIKDILTIATSSCARFLPFSRKGYNQLPTHATHAAANNNPRGSSRNEAENRLIDQLDEEWDD